MWRCCPLATLVRLVCGSFVRVTHLWVCPHASVFLLPLKISVDQRVGHANSYLQSMLESYVFVCFLQVCPPGILDKQTTSLSSVSLINNDTFPPPSVALAIIKKHLTPLATTYLCRSVRREGLRLVCPRSAPHGKVLCITSHQSQPPLHS
jgi:hypothetical protein